MAAKVKELCRLCAEPCSKEADQHSIDDETLRPKLETVFNFKVPSEDPLPEVVCQDCFSKVAEWYAYHESVRTNQSQLMSIAAAETHQERISMDSVKEEETDNEDDFHAEEVVEIKMESVKQEEEKNLSDSSEGSKAPVQNKSKRARKKSTKRSVPEKPKLDEKYKEQMEEENKKIRGFFNIICEFCSQTFDAFSSLQVHTRKEHDARAIIKCCNRIFYKKCRILEHIDSHVNPALYHCDECNRNYKTRFSLDLHNMKKHSCESEKPFKCDKCKSSFPKVYMLKAHLRTHVQVECPICHKLMASKLTLRAHMVVIHSDDKKKLICESCGLELRTKLAMERHMQKHQGLNPIERVKCEICGKCVNGKYNLKLHIQTVHNEEDQRVQCDVCQQIYPNLRALTSHKRAVHVEDKFECEFCGKRFKRAVALKEHRASHTGEALYSCNICGKTSNSSANLYTHKKSKHPEEWMESKKKAFQLTSG